MLYIKCEDNGAAGFGEQEFKVCFAIYGYGGHDQDNLNKSSFF